MQYQILCKQEKTLIGQPYFIANPEGKIGEKWTNEASTSHYELQVYYCVKSSSRDINLENDNKLYLLGLGMLLYLLKYSRLDITNTVKELLKVFDTPMPAWFKEMLQCIKYVLDTKKYGLKIQPTKQVGEVWD